MWRYVSLLGMAAVTWWKEAWSLVESHHSVDRRKISHPLKTTA